MIGLTLKKIGQNIKNARKMRNLSQEKLAELIGRSRNYVGMIERAECNTPIKTIIEISNVLNVPTKIFFE